MKFWLVLALFASLFFLPLSCAKEIPYQPRAMSKEDSLYQRKRELNRALDSLCRQYGEPCPPR